MSPYDESPNDYLAPHSVDAEEAVIGAVLLNPDIYQSLAKRLSSKSFFMLKNSYIWEAFERLSARGDLIDYLTLKEELEDFGKIEEIGGSAYITQLINHTPTHLHANAYADIVERAETRRKLLASASEIAQLAVSANHEIDDVVSLSASSLFAVVDSFNSGDGTHSINPLAKIASEFLDDVDVRMEKSNRDDVQYLVTGIEDIDSDLYIDETGFIIVGARPGMGKTSFKLGMFVANCRAGRVTIFYSLEMGSFQFMSRLVSMLTGISPVSMKKGEISDTDWAAIVSAVAEIATWNAFVSFNTNVSPRMIKADAMRVKRLFGVLHGIFVDYLQLMKHSDRFENRRLEIGGISRDLKALALEMKVPVVASSQLSRALEGRPDKRPVMSDLRESGDLEQDADVVMFIYRDDVYNENSEQPNVAQFLIRKNRDGATFTAEAYWDSSKMLFRRLRIEHYNLQTSPDSDFE